MTNREKLNSMTNEEIAEKLCYLVELVADAAGHDAAGCLYCPVSKLCRYGKPGFIEYLEKEAEETKDAQKV